MRLLAVILVTLCVVASVLGSEEEAGSTSLKRTHAYAHAHTHAHIHGAPPAQAAIITRSAATDVKGRRGKMKRKCPPRPMQCEGPLPNGTIGDPQLFRSVCMTHSVGAEPPTKRCLPWPQSKPGHNDTFRCGCCGKPLFPADAIYDSQTGWPAFSRPLKNAVCHVHGSSEVVCAHCGAHLGDFFPPKHYCIDGLCLTPPANPIWHNGCEHAHFMESPSGSKQ